MNKKELLLLSITVLLTLTSMYFASATPITLTNVTYEVPQTFCLGQDNYVNITPLDNNSNFTTIDGLYFNFTPDNIAFQITQAYAQANYYTVPIIITNTTHNNTIIKNYKLNIRITQQMKSLNHTFDIQVINCTNSTSIDNTLGNIDIFLSNNWLWLSGLIIVIVIMILITYLFKRKNYTQKVFK